MMTTMNYKKGIIAAVSGSFVWGILPIYWKSLVPIPSSVIIFYRIFWVGVVSFIVSWKLYGMDRIKEPLKDKKKVARLILAGVINTSNCYSDEYRLLYGTFSSMSFRHFVL